MLRLLQGRSLTCKGKRLLPSRSPPHADNLLSPLPPSTPPAPPAVSVEEAMGHLAALARSGRHVDRQLFVECCLGVAKNLGPMTCQKFIVAKVRGGIVRACMA